MKIKSIYLENIKNLDKIRIPFGSKLNILTGVNGTGKSTVLNCLIKCINRGSIDKNISKTDNNKIIINIDRDEAGEECLFENNKMVSSVVSHDETPILAFNPKRNFSMEEFQTIIQRTLTNKDWAKYSKDIASHFDNGGYDTILSIPEILSLKAKKLPEDTTPRNYIDQIASEFNDLVFLIFPNLKISNVEYIDTSSYKFIFENNGKVVDPNDLSTGEKEVLTLLVNIDYYKEDFQILIIDEPEAHLNWDLENKLFQTLLNFSKKQDRQIILTTHSRVLLEYLEHSDVNLINLSFDKETNLVTINNQNLAQELEEIIGKVTILDKYEKIIVCEDELHKKVLEKFNEDKVFTGKIKIVPLRDKGSVISFIKGIDRFPADEFKEKFIGYCDLDVDEPLAHARIITLSKYNIENFFIQSQYLYALDQGKSKNFTTQSDTESFILQKIKDKCSIELASYDQAEIDSKKIKKILPDVYEYLGYDRLDDFLKEYYISTKETNLFDEFIIK